jgi:hypothetical protein
LSLATDTVLAMILHDRWPHEPGYMPDCPACEAIPAERNEISIGQLTQVWYRTAGLLIHHDSRTVETFSNDSQTTHADWRRVCGELARLGLDPATTSLDELCSLQGGWDIKAGTF